MRLITDVFAWCRHHVPRWNTISISGYHMREAGCTAVQEVAFTLANAIAYVQAAVEAGLDVDSFAPQLSFFFNAHNDLIEEVAKFRAARRLWARIMRERFGARDPRSLMLRFHAQTAGSMLTAQQPENNIVRVTVQALAAVLGGCQSLHTNSMDEALALPTERAVRIALRTQQILAFESGVADTVDPLGGSFAVERLTRDIEEAAEVYIKRIDELGGSVAAIGYMQREIQDAAYRWQREVEDKARVVVGVNDFVTDEVAAVQPLPARCRGGGGARRAAGPPARDARRRSGRAGAGRAGDGRPRPRQPDAAPGGGRRGLGDARRDLRAPARGVRRAPALGDVLRRAAGLAVVLAVLLAVAAPAGAGIADRVAATFALMAGDFVKAFQPVGGRRGLAGGPRDLPGRRAPRRRPGRTGVRGLPQGRRLLPSAHRHGRWGGTSRSWGTPRSCACIRSSRPPSTCRCPIRRGPAPPTGPASPAPGSGWR